MESKLCTAWVPTALRPQLERTVAPDTELKLALQWKIEIGLSPLQPPWSSSQWGWTWWWWWPGCKWNACSRPWWACSGSCTTDNWSRARPSGPAHRCNYIQYKAKWWGSQTSTPSAWVSGLFSSFQRAKSAHEIPSCWLNQGFKAGCLEYHDQDDN